jgi:hypothetical protein
MAKIVTPRLPEATEEYSREQISQLVQTLEQVIFVRFSYHKCRTYIQIIKQSCRPLI